MLITKMVDVWNDSFVDIFRCFSTPDFDGWSTCDRLMRYEFANWVEDNGMDEALLNYFRTMYVDYRMDPQIMLDELMHALLTAGSETLHYLMDFDTGCNKRRIDDLKLVFMYLFENDVMFDHWSHDLTADYDEDMDEYIGRFSSYTIKLDLKAWLIDRLWGGLDETCFRDNLTSHVIYGDDSDLQDFRAMSWSYLTRTSTTLANL